MVFHYESESGAWLISTYLPAAWAVPIANKAVSARMLSKDRLHENVMIASSDVLRRRRLVRREAEMQV